MLMKVFAIFWTNYVKKEIDIFSIFNCYIFFLAPKNILNTMH